MPNYLKKLAAELAGGGLELPMPVASYFAGKTCPFALDTRERLADWAETHGYSEEQHKKLAKLIGLIASRDAYHQSVVVGGHRVDLDGADTGPVSEFDKESAVRARAAIAAAKQKPRPQAAQPAKPAPEPTKPSKMHAAVDTALARDTPELPALPVRSRPPAKATSNFVVVTTTRSRRTPFAPPMLMPRSARSPAARASRPPPPAFLPIQVIREAVEHVNGRRNSLRMIAAHLKAGRHAAVGDERAGWIDDSIKMLLNDGHPHDAVAVQVPQIVDYTLVDVIPRPA